ncbi:hypothetical protein DB346_16950 [Verrucomicrobia bacterium LW23]|nr:hypothetical protein DB346_16950 [Verrucomicrobia bacterium LW23]
MLRERRSGTFAKGFLEGLKPEAVAEAERSENGQAVLGARQTRDKLAEGYSKFSRSVGPRSAEW